MNSRSQEQAPNTLVLVRVTKRIHEAYFARFYLTKVPIQVNKFLAHSDGMKVVESAKVSFQGSPNGLIFKELDRPSGQPCIETKEFNLVRNMLITVVEERYRDAYQVLNPLSVVFHTTQWRDKLTQFRSKKNWA
uniref:Uncharacterized protein n=1 Tax=Lactuca sativa TaxID=4236 RepID=A0A9R1VXV6_LACSA|nr:hypothetical protein LSAT_V11C400226870 [Lactuca sativa]